MNKLFQAFAKITGWPIYWLCFKTKIHYENKRAQGRKLKGPTILISNHTSVYDYAVMLFVFPFRFLRYLMAELLFKKPGLGLFLKLMGGIKVDRNNYDFSFVSKSLNVLENKGVVGVFPEGRLPKEGEERPIPFKPSAAYLAYLSEANVVPVYTDGTYFKLFKRAHVIIGQPINIKEIIAETLSEKENIEKINEILRKRIIELGKKLEEKKQNKKEKKKSI